MTGVFFIYRCNCIIVGTLTVYTYLMMGVLGVDMG